eukprot:1542676-Pyramimonas_sp.AAC.1
MFSFDLSSARQPTMLSVMSLPDGINHVYQDALFVDISSLVLLDNWGAKGQVLYFLSLDYVGNASVVFEIHEHKAGATLAGAWT